jgi:hypothetical protein
VRPTLSDPSEDPFMREVNRWFEKQEVFREGVTAEAVQMEKEVAAEEESRTGGEGGDTSSAFDSSYAFFPTSAKTGADISYAESLRGDELAYCDRLEDLARSLVRRLGIDFETTSIWAIGGRELSVKLWRDLRGLYVLRVFEGWPGREGLALAEAYAIATTGVLRSPRAAEMARWKLRMLVEFGFLNAARVELAPLPPNASPSEITTWRIVHELLSVRRLTEPPGEPFTFSAPWVASAYGVELNVLRAGKLGLAKRGHLRKVGSVPSRGGGRPTDLWQAKECGN